MDESQKNILVQAGIDIDSVIERFCGKSELALRFLKKFPQDSSFSSCKDALQKGETEAAFQASHTLKGIAGNLGLKALFEANNAVVEPLRIGDLEGGRQNMPQVEEAYNQVLTAIKALED